MKCSVRTGLITFTAVMITTISTAANATIISMAETEKMKYTEEPETTLSVSYTYLDVYKRQHTDRGCQYVSGAFCKATSGMVNSYSRKAYPWDNACIESFHALLKREWINRFKIFNYQHAYKLVFEYIETFYNTVRTHSHCEYLSPNQYEDVYKRQEVGTVILFPFGLKSWVTKKLRLDKVPEGEALFTAKITETV